MSMEYGSTKYYVYIKLFPSKYLDRKKNRNNFGNEKALKWKKYHK